MNKSSFFVEHPWMTLFLGLAVVHGVVTVVRGYEPPPQPLRLTPHVRGTYRS